ncbi:MAG: hypothetical protein M3O28_07690, partial [Actinomycetota bacterium]|nr:hypothetical protein [Actinomycetota bacterium]
MHHLNNRGIAGRCLAATLLAGVLAMGHPPSTLQAGAAATTAVQDWPQYLHDITRGGYTTDNAVTAANARTLRVRPRFPVNLGGKIISTQPVVANGFVYSGSWDGNEYAINPTGAVTWKTALGSTNPNDASCGGTEGVASTPAFATLTLMADPRPSNVLFLGAGGNDIAGGGQARVDALDATTGRIRWSVPVGPAPATYMWSSPVVYT